MKQTPKQRSASAAKMEKIYAAMEKAGEDARRSARPVRMPTRMNQLNLGTVF